MEHPEYFAKQVADHLIKIFNQKEWLTEAEATELLGIKKTTLYSFVNGGKITYSKITGRSRLYSRRSIMRYIEKNQSRAFAK